MLGGSSIGGSFAKTFTSLPAHSVIYVYLKFYGLDDWRDFDDLFIKFDGSSKKVTGLGRTCGGCSSPYSTNICGGATNDPGLIELFLQIPHASSSLTLNFIPNLSY